MAVKTKSELKTLSNNTYPTNGLGAITAASVRSFNDDLIDSLAAEGSSSSADNMVTTDTMQTITGNKTFSAYTIFTAGAGTGSDMRFKTSLFEAPLSLKDIQEIEIFGYDWEREGDEIHTTIGLNGDKLEGHPVFKLFTRRANNDEALLTVDYGKLAAAVAIKGIQELIEENAKLKSALAAICDKLGINL
jgi:hypothetical protein